MAATPKFEFLPDTEKLPATKRSEQKKDNPYKDAVKQQRPFRVVADNENDKRNVVYLLRSAAGDQGLGVRIIVGDPKPNGSVEIKAQGQPKRRRTS